MFVALIFPKLLQVVEPCIDCLNDIHYLLEDMVDKIVSKIFMRFPNVSSEIAEIVKMIIANHKEKTLYMIKSMTDADLN